MAPWRERLHTIIFEADTPGGKAFDIVLLVLILISVITVSLETVDGIASEHKTLLVTIEWILTGLFTIEYVLRLICVKRPTRYALSFFGLVDLLSILPTYISIVVPAARGFAVIRAFRFLRAFRVFKLARMLTEAAALRKAIWDARGKIIVFLTTVIIVVTIAGPAMYFVENLEAAATGADRHFTSIPQAMYWAIVTMTTVGYGDIVPQTTLGKFLSAILIMVGYSLIIVPTGFVSAELVHARRGVSTQVCPSCMAEGHNPDAVYCRRCSHAL